MSEGRISINSNQDATGSNGALSEKTYDVHCHEISGGRYTYMMNYYKSSCAVRMENGTCTKPGECPRFPSARKEG